MKGCFLTLEQAKIIEEYYKKGVERNNMNISQLINVKENKVILNNGKEKILDNYVLELEDRLLKVYGLLKKYEDVDPNKGYILSGEELFEILDVLEGRK